MLRLTTSRHAWIAALLLAGAAGVVTYFIDSSPSATPGADSPLSPAAPPLDRRGAATTGTLAGDDPMGAAVRLFHIGYAGGLQIDEDTRGALDALVNAMPESPSADDLARVEKSVRLSLPFDDAERVLKLVHGYIGYRREVSGLLAASEPPANADALRQLFAKVDAIQQRHFAPGEEGLFGPRALEARRLMEIMLIQQDATLTDAQKQERIDALHPQASPVAPSASGA